MLTLSGLGAIGPATGAAAGALQPQFSIAAIAPAATPTSTPPSTSATPATTGGGITPITSTDPNVLNTYRHLQFLLNMAVLHLYGTGQATQLANINGVIDAATVNAANAIGGATPPCATDPSCATPIMQGDIVIGTNTCCNSATWLAANAQAMIVWLETYLGVTDQTGSDQWYVPPMIACPDGSSVPVGTPCPQPSAITTMPTGTMPPAMVTCSDGSQATDPSLCPQAQPAPGSSTGMMVTPVMTPPTIGPSPIGPPGYTCPDGSMASDPSLCPVVQPTLFGVDPTTLMYAGAAVIGAFVVGSLLLRRRPTTAPRPASNRPSVPSAPRQASNRPPAA